MAAINSVRVKRAVVRKYCQELDTQEESGKTVPHVSGTHTGARKTIARKTRDKETWSNKIRELREI
jgi:hypothetical protein